MNTVRFHMLARIVLGTVLLGLLYGCEFSRTIDTSSPQGSGDTSTHAGSGIALALDPTSTSVPTGGSEQFQATITGTADARVLWSVTSGPGSISTEGLYTAPATITGDSVTAVIRAASVADSSAAAAATITVFHPAGGGPGDTTVSAAVCFQQDVLPIFVSSCALSGCHDAGTHKEGLILTSYAAIAREVSPGNPSRSKIYQMITNAKGGRGENDIMPPRSRSPLTADQIALIRKWIEEGARNTSCTDNGGGGCDTVSVTFAGTIKPIFQNNCVGCHSGSAAPNGVNLTSYAGAKAVAGNGKLAGVIQHSPGFSAMPKGGAKLPDCKVAQILAWINRGAPNN